MIDSPCVSTIITSYNKAPYLGEAVESALRQDHRPHQVLVVDDGSTDNTREIAAGFGERVQYAWQPNGGQSSALNHGIRLARGELIAFLDGDDRWRPGKLSKQVEVFRENPRVAVVYCRAWVFDHRTGLAVPRLQNSSPLINGDILDAMLVANFIPFSSTMARRDRLLEVGMFDESVPFPNDLDLWLRIARGHWFDYVDEELLEYRVGIQQVTSTIDNAYLRALAIQRRFVERFFEGKYPRPSVVRRATAAKHAAHGDLFLARGRHLRAFKAHAMAAAWEPLEPARYFALLRDLIPNRCVAGLWRLCRCFAV